MSCCKKVILTGATGLIGRNVIEPLKEMGFEIYALTIDSQSETVDGVNWVNCNIFDEESIEKIFSEVKPTHLLNFAWATTGDYLTSDINYEFKKAGLNLLKYFKENGGKRAVYAGTCFEYKFKDELIKEYDKTEPKNLYAECKDDLRKEAEEFCKANGLSFGWGRIFYVFGQGENKTRLTGALVDKFSNEQEVVIRFKDLEKDYLYTKDIAGAFAKFLDTEVSGCVNICSGKGISLGDYALKFARKMRKEHLLILKQEETDQPKRIIGDNTRLTEEVGYKIKYEIDEAVEEILENL